ncbi:hypothetical protein [Lactobacillus delbrueckii]|uniref:hypothetical protein n=1 Tax=Lactobacillus delbrueckii TaxID=1584 RepID=UPI00385339CC
MIEAKKSARNSFRKWSEMNNITVSERSIQIWPLNTDLASVLLGFSLGGLAITFTPGKVAAADNTAAEVTTT